MNNTNEKDKIEYTFLKDIFVAVIIECEGGGCYFAVLKLELRSVLYLTYFTKNTSRYISLFLKVSTIHFHSLRYPRIQMEIPSCFLQALKDSSANTYVETRVECCALCIVYLLIVHLYAKKKIKSNMET